MEVEYTLRNNASADNVLISYAVPSVDNEIYLRVSANGTIQLTIDGNATASTSSTYPILLDGKTHAVAVTWDNTNGDVSFYIDGQFVQTITGIKAGTTLAGGGTLVMGQEQDSVDGGYNAAQSFSGTLHDVRVWNRAISGEQISQNYQQKLGDVPPGLIANWRMNGFNGSNQVVDSVGGVNLSVANVTGEAGIRAHRLRRFQSMKMPRSVP